MTDICKTHPSGTVMNVQVSQMILYHQVCSVSYSEQYLEEEEELRNSINYGDVICTESYSTNTT
jgi:hypothetical protein